MGWLTTEELWWDAKGRLRTHAPTTYKIPACCDRPRDLQRPPARERAEPRGHDLPLQGRGRAAADAGHLGAARAVGRRRQRRATTASARALDAPATPERVLVAVERLRARPAGGAAA